MSEVVTLGECLIAFVATAPGALSEATTFERFVAGAEANVAVGLARLGHEVAFIGRVGADGFGDAIRRRLLGEGVRGDGLTTDEEAATAVMFRERRLLGPAQVLYARRDSAGSRLSAADVDRAAAGATVSLDLNLRRLLWSDDAAGPVLRALAGRVDVVLGSPDELAVVTGLRDDDDPAALVRAAVDLGPAIAVAKLGADGAQAVDREGDDLPVARSGVPLSLVVDPVGAGDAFCAGFIAARLGGVDLAGSLEIANACGASAAAALGDQTGLPDRAELAAILRSASETGGPDTIR